MFKVKMANYDKTSGVSIVTIITELGEFTGVSRLHEDDKENASSFFGCEIAEMRALIAYSKRNQLITSHQYKAIKDMYKNLEQMKDFNKESVEARKIRRKLYELSEEWRQWKDNVKSLEANIAAKCVARDAMMKNIHKRGKIE
jgi:pantothenate synthetase